MCQKVAKRPGNHPKICIKSGKFDKRRSLAIEAEYTEYADYVDYVNYADLVLNCSGLNQSRTQTLN